MTAAGHLPAPTPQEQPPMEGRIIEPASDVLAPAGDAPPVHNPAAVYLATLDAGTSRPTMRRALDVVARLLSRGELDHTAVPWHLLRYEHTSAVAAHITATYAPNTANKMLSGLTQVIDTCWKLGLYDADTRDRIKAYNRSGGRRPEAAEAGRQLQQGELRALFSSCADDDSALGARDAALLALLYGLGLRRAEASALDLAHYNEPEDKITVHGKRNKVRIVHVTDPGVAGALATWLDVRGHDPGPLLLTVRKSGRIAEPRKRLSLTGIYNALDKRARRAGVAKFAPHDLRRSHIGDLLDAGADLSTVSQLVGHSRPDTTAGYDRRGERAKRRAASLLHVPFQPRTTIKERRWPAPCTVSSTHETSASATSAPPSSRCPHDWPVI